LFVQSDKGWKTRRRGTIKQVSSANNSRDQQAAIYGVKDDKETGSTKDVNSRRYIVSRVLPFAGLLPRYATKTESFDIALNAGAPES
jgi:hypothetical protein